MQISLLRIFFVTLGFEMKKWRHILIAAMLIGAIPTAEGALKWEYVSASAATDDTTDPDKVEVLVKDGYIYVDTSKPVTVKLMSILGQLVSQHNLPAGVSRIKMSARGIYILKAGDFTKRVTV